MILDAAPLIAVDRGERRALAFAAAVLQRGERLHICEPVIAQVWRSGSRQARLSQFLRSAVRHDLADGREVGELLGRAGTADVVDAHLVLVAASLGEAVVTGDPGDIDRLIEALPAARRPRRYLWN